MAIDDPTDITNCVLWLKSDTGITEADAAGRVSAWADQSGAGNNFAQATATAQPYIYDDSVFGKRVTFNPAGTQPHWLASSISVSSQSFSIFAVHRLRANGSNVQPLFNTSTSAGRAAVLVFNNIPCVYNGGGGGIRYSTNFASNILDFTGYCSGSDGIDVYSGHTKTSLSAITSESTTYGSLGRWNSDTVALFQGDFIEVFAYSKKLDASEQADVLDYLQKKTGVLPRENNIVMIGDSITAGVGSIEGRNLQYYLEQSLPLNCRVRNAGISGYTWNQIASNVTAESVVSGQRNIVIAWAGTNDIAAGDSAATAATDKGTCLASWTAQGWEPVTVHMLPRTGVLQATTDAYNTLLSAGPETVVSWADIPQLSDGFAEYFSDDDIHPTSRGYQVAANEIGRVINKLLDPEVLLPSEIASAVRTELATELARIDVAVSTRQSAGPVVGAMSTTGSSGSLRLYNNRTYGTPAHAAIEFTVSKNYSTATSVELVLFRPGDPLAVIQRISGTVDSSTLVSVSGTVSLGTEYLQGKNAFECKYSLKANWSGELETIADGKAYIFDQPT
jgi:lysophospholipase L1-like esterase